MYKYLFPILFCCLFACSDNGGISADCITFENEDIDQIKEDWNPFLETLDPFSTNMDYYGHEENLATFLESLIDNCDQMNFEIACYACIKTEPPMSEISYTNSEGDTRIIDIRTPKDDVMKVVRIH